MRKIFIGGLITISLSAIGSFLASLPFYTAFGVVIASCLAVALIACLVVLAEKKVKSIFKKKIEVFVRSLEDSQEKLLTERMYAIDSRLRTVEEHLGGIGALRYVKELRDEIAEISKERETVMAANPNARTYTTMTEVLARLSPGKPLCELPVVIGTDSSQVQFSDLEYEVITKDVGKFQDHEKLLFQYSKDSPDYFSRFIIRHCLNQNHCLKHGEEPLTFACRYVSKSLNPSKDWAAIVTGVKTSVARIIVWFPSDKWEVDACKALKGPPEHKQEQEEVYPDPRWATAIKDGARRTFIRWEKTALDESATYSVHWVAHENPKEKTGA
jgi:hypothetical protein